VYGEQADKNLLEEAVRWVIITIIFVFDPLAVLLLIASQYTFEWNRKRKPKPDNDEWKHYEQMRAEVIAANVPPTFEPEPEEEYPVDLFNNKAQKHEEAEAEEELPSAVDDAATAMAESAEDSKEYPDTKNAFFFANEIEESKKKDLRLKAGQSQAEQTRREHIDALEADASIAERKREWKQANPDENLKSWKTLYIQGRIDKLPWVPDEDGYVQNGEQSDDTIWKRLKK
jgi:hypothetical protein